MKQQGIPYLSTSNLSVGFRRGKKEVLLFKSLEMKLFPGELVCFMGPNGIGKSSLIRTLAGLQVQLSGYTYIKGTPGLNDRSRQIAVVLTEKITSANMTVSDVVAFGRYPYLNWNVALTKADREVVEHAIRRVHIDHLADGKIYSLSDGQLQMVMIARALAQDTPILLLDEPTAHLDLNNRVEIMRLLRSLAAETNKAILVATHELDLALQMADRIWLTGSEKNILTGIPEDLVLNGAFDEIFQFKGFDLKTGKIQHAVVRDTAISIHGSGYEYRWTKNALERNGFNISDDAAVRVVISREGQAVRWQLIGAGNQRDFGSVEELINSL